MLAGVIGANMCARFFMVFLFLTLCSCEKEKVNLSEETEYFKFSKAEMENTIDVNIRPIKFDLRIPRNHLKSISHPYMPWAKEIWDKVVLEALLPNLEFKSESNIESFKSPSGTDILTIRIGFLSQDESFLSATVNGEYEEVDNFFDFDARAYVNRRKYGNQSIMSIQNRKPNIFVINKEYMSTPSGNPIVINCKIGVCQVRMVIPSTGWQGDELKDFGGTKGIGLEYVFDPKYVASWEKIHDFVILNVRSYIKYPKHAL